MALQNTINCLQTSISKRCKRKISVPSFSLLLHHSGILQPDAISPLCFTVCSKFSVLAVCLPFWPLLCGDRLPTLFSALALYVSFSTTPRCTFGHCSFPRLGLDSIPRHEFRSGNLQGRAALLQKIVGGIVGFAALLLLVFFVFYQQYVTLISHARGCFLY